MTTFWKLSYLWIRGDCVYAICWVGLNPRSKWV